MGIRFLDPTLVNQIAAGEVVERPASAIKELVENAIDAGSTKIDIIVREGGRTFISVTDNGQGMNYEDLVLSVERHATSKIPDSDLFNIRTLGFRGEALPSIGAVSRLTITSRVAGSEEAWRLDVEGGSKREPLPASFGVGTKIEVRDLFYATPARLKFLKSPATELTHTIDILNRLALAHPFIQFSLKEGERQTLSHGAESDRLSAVLGKDFPQNSCRVSLEREGLALKGHISVPTYNRSNATAQYLFVNGRPVKDKILSNAIRAAYQDFLASSRHPVLALFLQVDPAEVDINVHPAKAEVRFRDSGLVRGALVSALKNALHEAAHRSSTTIAENAIAAFQAPSPVLSTLSLGTNMGSSGGWAGKKYLGRPVKDPAFSSPLPLPFPGHSTPQLAETLSRYHSAAPENNVLKEPLNHPAVQNYPLGQAQALLHGTYILAETADGLVIVDQHAAHERLVYEKMKHDHASRMVKRQALLLPEVVDLTEEELRGLLSHKEKLYDFGLKIEAFGLTAVMVREVPALLAKADWKQLVKDLATDIQDIDPASGLSEQINEILSLLACRNSIRAGRQLSREEMNALLRQMEACSVSGQCNHGRPTYVRLQKNDIEKLFGRK